MKKPRILLMIAAVGLASICVATATNDNRPAVITWRADHHMHLSSPELCARLGASSDEGCLASNHPPAVYAADAVKALDEAQVAKGVVLSGGYLYGMPSLHLSPSNITKYTRLENEFTADQVAAYPMRLVAFLSVNPLQDSAIEELDFWAPKSKFVGVKLHFTASDVNLRNAANRQRVSRVLAEADKNHLPLLIHLGGGDFSAPDAELFITEVLPHAGDTWVQIAHAGGGFPKRDGNNLAVLRTFADHITKNDPRTKKVLFDLSFVPGPEGNADDAQAFTQQIRRIGIQRFLFGSDFNVRMPKDAVRDLEKLGLTPEELRALRQNCAPWAC